MDKATGTEANVSDPETAGLRLLVVDDHADSADSLAMLLMMWGHQPHVAYDFTGALRTAQVEQLDAVILDLGLPGRNGYELAGDLRKQNGWQRTPFVALTGFGDRLHRVQAKEAGFDFFLVKPVEPASLRVLLEDLLRVTRLTGRMEKMADRHAALATQTVTLAEEARVYIQTLQQQPGDAPI
jgi:DNA-binding response OmpR family regulator